MKDFLQQHENKTQAVPSCFDRLIFRGYLPWVSYPSAMERFLNANKILFKDFKPFVLAQAERIKQHARDAASKVGRPYVYLNGAVRMEERARSMARDDGITRGLICVPSRAEATSPSGAAAGPTWCPRAASVYSSTSTSSTATSA